MQEIAIDEFDITLRKDRMVQINKFYYEKNGFKPHMKLRIKILKILSD